MTIIFDGKTLAKTKLELLKQRIKTNNIAPKLAIILVGNDPASKVYVEHKMQAATKIGAEALLYHYDKVDQSNLESKINELNQDESVNGILLQLPIPNNLDKYKLFSLIDPNKDVDGFNPLNKGLMDNGLTQMIPATAKSVLDVFNSINLDLKGKEVLLIGYSDLLGMPLVKYLLKANATVKVVHAFSKDWKNALNTYDIIISSVGKPELFNANDVKEGVILIGVGIYRDANNNLVGDFNHNDFLSKAFLVTPTPGGVGPLTVVNLLETLVLATEKKALF